MFGKSESCNCTSARLGTVRAFSTVACAAAALLAIGSTARAQTYNMATTTETTCSGTFFDSGGSGANYSSGEDLTETFFPGTAGQNISVTFISYDTESGFDKLSIFDGNSDAAPVLLDQYSGTTNPGTFTSSAADGSLTFKFHSDGSLTHAGWEATISCVASGSGACCLLNGTCQNVTNGTVECGNLGGVYKGDGTDCGSVSCVGACCLGNGNCSAASELSCNNAGGSYLGDGTTCGVDPCPPANDTCATAEVVSCDTMLTGLTLDGANKDVTLVSTGSCTTFDADGPDVVFSFTPDSDGLVSAGMTNYVGFDATFYVITDCGNTNATCVAGNDDGGNEEVTFIASAGTTYFMIADSWTDDPAPGTSFDFYVSCAPIPTGACCLPAGGGCSEMLLTDCDTAGGTFAGADTVCFSYDINTGMSNGGYICEGSCSDLTVLRNSPAQSASVDIMFNNDLASADEASGSCTGSSGNVANDALFRYLAISDTNGPCDVTITATPTGYDAVLVVRTVCSGGGELACSDVGLTGGAESVTLPSYGPGVIYISVGDYGSFEGGGPTQLEINCSTATGACCLGGTCELLTAGDCQTAGGIYKGDNTDCMSSCFGACCFTNGSCQSETEVSCDADGGNYQGDGVSCTPNPCPQPAENDDCAGAIEITQSATPFTIDSTVHSSGLAACGDFPFGNDEVNFDLFYSYTATCDGALFVNTCGDESNDTRLAIYDVDCAAIDGGALPIECNDDHGNSSEGDTGDACPGSLEASLSIPCTSGTTYIIRVGTFSTSPSLPLSDVLHVECRATCSTCPGDVNGDSVVNGLDIQSFSNCYLSDAPGSPSSLCGCADVNEDTVIDDSDIAAFVARVLQGGICNPGACCYLDMGSAACAVTNQAGCDMLGGTFTLGADCSGDPCPNGRCCTDDGATCNDIPEVECAALGGDWDGGLDCINDPCPITPVNDDCGGALPAFDGANPVDLTNATSSGLTSCSDPFPVGDNEVHNDEYYTYTASCDGTLFVDTCGDSDDTRLAIYDVDCAAIAGGALPINCNDDHASGNGNTCTEGLAASLSVPCTMGQTFIIRVGSYTSSAVTFMFNLNIQCVAAGNGACCLADGNCVDVTTGESGCMGLGGTYNGDGSTCATTICGGACCLPNGDCSDVMTGSDCDDLGGTYQGNGTECASTSCPQPAPPNDDCDNAITVVTGTNVLGNNCGAIDMDDKEASCQSSSGHDVYYVWTADCDGQATVDTEGMTFDTVLSVYETSCGGPEIACDDDGGTGTLSNTSFLCSSGTDYIIRLAGFSSACGDITLNIACVSGGACCVNNMGNAECSQAMDASDCEDNLGGTYQGDFTTCGDTVCGGACCLANGNCTQAVDASACIDDLGGTVFWGDGTTCSDPFVMCPGPGECFHTITLFDTFGDGWNGGAIEVFVNGVSVYGGAITLPDQGQVNVPVSGSAVFVAGTGDTITTTYTQGGTFDNENSWEITDGGGSLVCEDLGGASGPDTTAMRSCGTGNCP